MKIKIEKNSSISFRNQLPFEEGEIQTLKELWTFLRDATTPCIIRPQEEKGETFLELEDPYDY